MGRSAAAHRPGRSAPRARVIVAELLGTGALVCAVVGSGVMGDALSGGNDGVALLANTIATAAALLVLIAVLSPVSGAHFNPIVTLVAAWSQRSAPRPVETAAVVVAQCAGGVGGTIVAHAMFGLPLLQRSLTTRAAPGQWLGEVVATGGLLLVIAGVGRLRPGLAPFVIAGFIASAYWFTSSTSFANPAVTLARGFTDTFAGIRPDDIPAFVIAQLLGGIGGAVLGRWLFAPDAPEEQP